MRASLLPNGHLVGTGEASPQSLSQSPVLGRHGNKQRGAREMGERSQDWGERQVSVRLSLIQLHAAAMSPSPVDTLCASQTNGLSPCSAALFLSHRQAPPPLTHTQAHTLPPHTRRLTHPTDTHTLTQSHTLLTNPHSPTHTPHTP